VHPLELFRTLLDPGRLAIVGAIALEARTSVELAATTGRSQDDVLRVLGPLVQAGLVRAEGGRYHLDALALAEVARQLPSEPDASPRVTFGMTADEAQLLTRFFVGDRLTELPAQRAARTVVLERLALEFEPGVRYDEGEVNQLLRRFHDDYTTLRRALVDEQLLDRAGGEYWRSGGRVL
jgi:hypothetical protein